MARPWAALLALALLVAGGGVAARRHHGGAVAAQAQAQAQTQIQQALPPGGAAARLPPRAILELPLVPCVAGRYPGARDFAELDAARYARPSALEVVRRGGAARLVLARGDEELVAVRTLGAKTTRKDIVAMLEAHGVRPGGARGGDGGELR